MDMGGGDMTSDGPSCKISMLWNWYTIDSCFLASTWHVRSSGAFAASCIGVICLVVVLELLRRVGKEYDSSMLRQFQQAAATRSASTAVMQATHDSASSSGSQSLGGPQFPAQYLTFRPSVLQQTIRSVIHMVTFAVAYFVMLLAMYFNGYIIICIFIGALIGKFVCDWPAVKIAVGGGASPTDAKGEQDLTYCCG